jgi:hypothetical protein
MYIGSTDFCKIFEVGFAYTFPVIANLQSIACSRVLVLAYMANLQHAEYNPPIRVSEHQTAGGAGNT